MHKQAPQRSLVKLQNCSNSRSKPACHRTQQLESQPQLPAVPALLTCRLCSCRCRCRRSRHTAPLPSLGRGRLQRLLLLLQLLLRCALVLFKQPQG